MKETFKAFVNSPMTYVIAFAIFGAVSVVAGVAVIAGAGWAFVSAGGFLLSASAYITKGLTPNG